MKHASLRRQPNERRPHISRYLPPLMAPIVSHLTSSATVITAVHTVHSIRRLFVCLFAVCWTGLIGFVTIADDRSQKRNHGRNLTSSATVITAVHSIRRLFVCWTGLIGFVTIADDRSQKRNHGRNLMSSATVITAVHTVHSIRRLFICLFAVCWTGLIGFVTIADDRSQKRNHGRNLKSSATVITAVHTVHSIRRLFVCLFAGCWTGLIGFVTIADDRSQKRNHGRNLKSSATVITAVHTVHSIRRLFVCLFAGCWTELIGFVTIADDRSQKRNHGRNLTSSATVITAVHSPQYQTFVCLFAGCWTGLIGFVTIADDRSQKRNHGRNLTSSATVITAVNTVHSIRRLFVCLFAVCWTGLIGFVTIADDRSQKRNQGRNLTSSATVITAVHTVHSIRRLFVCLFVCCLLDRTHWLRHNCRRQITEAKSRQELDELCHRYNCRPHSPQYQTFVCLFVCLLFAGPDSLASSQLPTTDHRSEIKAGTWSALSLSHCWTKARHK
ncbi:hypothetical protein J6590_103194 [Homalodisca vitripennis]|nr:hypothetical protein J6590_103194 [Homalodisca vitripennis]